MKEPTLPSPDTNCFDEDTKTDCWSYSSEQMQAFYKKGYEQAMLDAVNASLPFGQTGRVIAAVITSLKS